MEWDVEEQKKKNNGDLTPKILIAIMIFLVIIIAIIAVLLYVINSSTFKLSIDNKNVKVSEKFIKTESNTTYINIQELSRMLGYEYHSGEYKVYSSDSDKCYVKSDKETASFYLNSDKIRKLKVDEITNDYEECSCSNNIITINNEFYAPIDAMERAFNVTITVSENNMNITTLTALINSAEKSLNKNQDEKIYSSLSDTTFENQKALLYGYIIASKADSGLYSVISLNTGKEIVPDKYNNITFLENTKEFLVTNNLDKMGIIDENGQNKIEQLYDSIKVINSNPKLYLVGLNEKYGVINESGDNIIYTEYDMIGINNSEGQYPDLKNQYILLDKLIPVKKNNKYGLYDIEGTMLLDFKYDGIGCNITSVELNESSKSVTPIIIIKECNGLVIKNGENYDLYLADEEKLISLKVSSIYSVKENGQTNYYMIFKNKEMNLIDKLKELGYIKEQDYNEDLTNNEINSNNISENLDNVQTNITQVNITNNI